MAADVCVAAAVDEVVSQFDAFGFVESRFIV